MKNTSNKTTKLVRSYTRYLALIAGTLCTSAPLAQADYESEILSENPLAYFRFNDSVATDGLDATIATNLGSLGAAGNGSFDGVYTRGVAGAISGNNSISFSQAVATDINYLGSVIVPNNAALNPSHTAENPFTVECWVKPKNNLSTLLTPPVLDDWSARSSRVHDLPKCEYLAIASGQ